MKIMYILFDGFDTNNGTNHLALTMMERLLDSGKSVYLITSHTKGLHPDIPSSLKENKNFTYSVIQRAVVGKSDFVHRYLDGMKYAINASKEWRKNINSVDAVILQSTQTAVFSMVQLKKYAPKIPVVFNSFDVFPDGVFMNGAIKNKAAFTVLHNLQNIIYKNSKYVIAISEDMKSSLEKIGVPKEKIKVIYNWYDDSKIKVISDSENEFVKKYNIDTKKFIVQYAGNFGYNFDYKAVLNTAEKLLPYGNIEIHMIGEGGFEKIFKEEAKLRKLSNIKFYPWQDQSIISDVYSSCDIEYIPLTKKVIYYSYPSKGSLLMACGKSVLCAIEKNSHYYKMVNEMNIGFCVDRDNPDAAANLIIELSNDPERMRITEANAKEFANKFLSSSYNMKRLNLLLDSI